MNIQQYFTPRLTFDDCCIRAFEILERGNELRAIVVERRLNADEYQEMLDLFQELQEIDVICARITTLSK